MSTKYFLTPVFLFVIAAFVISACDNSTGPKEVHNFPDAIDSVATDITLYVYAGEGYIPFGKLQSISETSAPVIIKICLDTLELGTEGPITIDIPDIDFYVVYAEADGFYTKLYNCTKGVPTTIDLDAVPQVPNSVTGVIFEEGSFFADCYFADKSFALTVPGGNSVFGTTDSLGRFGFSNLDKSRYILNFSYMGQVFTFDIFNGANTDYQDLSFMAETVVEAPNIYLYPETTSDVTVALNFPQGGTIVNSEPPYNNGWKVTATPEGLIDNQYNYLFYEVSMAVEFNRSDGWLLDGSKIGDEFRFLLANLGYYDNEIDDFLEYWLPRLGNFPYFAVYPQDAESMIKVNISPPPDEFLRSIFAIVPLTKPIALNELPLPDAIKRDGFTAVEWGAILVRK